MSDHICDKIAWNILFALHNAGYLNIPRGDCALLAPGIAKIIKEQKDYLNFDEELGNNAKFNNI